MRKSVMILIMIITIMVGLSGCTIEQPMNDSLSEENLQETKTLESKSTNQKEIDTIESSTIRDKIELVMYDQKLSEGLSSVMRERMPEVTFSYLQEEKKVATLMSQKKLFNVFYL